MLWKKSYRARSFLLCCLFFLLLTVQQIFHNSVFKNERIITYWLRFSLTWKEVCKIKTRKSQGPQIDYWLMLLVERFKASKATNGFLSYHRCRLSQRKKSSSIKNTESSIIWVKKNFLLNKFKRLESEWTKRILDSSLCENYVDANIQHWFLENI